MRGEDALVRQVFGPLFAVAALLAFVQLGFGARLRGRRGRIRTRVNTLVLFASAARAAYFGLGRFLTANAMEQLYDVFYPVVLSGFALTTAFLAECYHAQSKFPGRRRCWSLNAAFGLSAVETSSTYGAMVVVVFGLLAAKILTSCLQAASSAWQLRIAVYAVLVVLSTMCTLAFWVYSLEFFQNRMGRPNHWRERCGLVSAAVFQLLLIGFCSVTLFSVADRSPFNPHILLLGHVLELAICTWWIGVLWLSVPFSTSPPAPALWILSPEDCLHATDEGERPPAPAAGRPGPLARLLGQRLRLRSADPQPAGLLRSSPPMPVQKGRGAGAAPVCGARGGEDEEVASRDSAGCSAGSTLKRLCWICYEHDSESRLLRRPCACTGTMSAVHDGCLREWLKSQTGSGLFPTHPRCSVCRVPYRCHDFQPLFTFARALRRGARTIFVFLACFSLCVLLYHFVAQALGDWLVVKLLLSLLLILNEFALVMFFGPHLSRLFLAARAEAWRFVPYEPPAAYGACDQAS